MTTALLGGCGSVEEDMDIPQENGDVSQNTDAGPEEGVEQEDSTEDGAEITEIVVGLMSFAPVDSSVQDRIEAAVNEMMEEQIHVTADFQWYDASTYATQIPMMIQSGEQLDVIMFTPVPAAGYSSFMSQNQLLDIREQIEAYGQDIQAVLGESGLAATARDGGIYGVGAHLCNYSGEAIVIKKEVLEEINMLEKFQSMETWTDLEEILTAAVSAGYPGMANSDAEGTCITPLPYINGSDKLADAYWVDLAGDGNQQVYIDPSDDKVKCYYQNQDYKVSLIRAGDWYSKGLIYKDASTAEEFGVGQIKNNVGIALPAVQQK